MRSCPYCLYRFPDEARGCPRCDNVLPYTAPSGRGAAAQPADTLTARPGARPTAGLPSALQAALAGRKLLVVGGAAALLVIVLSLMTLPRLFGRKAEVSTPFPTARSTRQPTLAAFPTLAPPGGWREWLLAMPDSALKVWLPEEYVGVNFSYYDWEERYAAALAQDAYVRGEANKVRSGKSPDTLLAAVAPRAAAASVRVLLLKAPTLTGGGAPDEAALQALVNSLGIQGDVLNQRDLKMSDPTCNRQVVMTRMEIVPASKDPDAWRGYVLATSQDGEMYVMVSLTGQRDFPGQRTSLEQSLVSLCHLLPDFRPTPLPSPTPSPRPTFTEEPTLVVLPTATPTSTRTPTPTPTSTPTPTPSQTPTRQASPTSTPTPSRSPSPGPSPTPGGPLTPTPAPTRPPDWRPWRLAGGQVDLALPQTYQVVDFTDSDWRSVYSPTLVSDSFLRLEAVRVYVGLAENSLLAAASHPSDTLPVRVLVLEAPELAGEARPTTNRVQPLLDRIQAGMAQQVRLGAASELPGCGALKTSFALTSLRPVAPDAQQGVVVVVNTPDKAYALAILMRPSDEPGVAALLDGLAQSLCLLDKR